MANIDTNMTEVITAEELSSIMEESDYVFVVDKDGLLKVCILPNELDEDEIPDNVAELIDFFDMDFQYTPQVIH